MFGLIGNFGPWEIGFILVIVLIIFGPGKLPQLGKSLGDAIRGFRKASDGELEDNKDKE
jgi:sec-independent protein translocase protein TatA